KRLHIAPLAFGIDGVKGQRRLSGAGDAGDHRHGVVRNLKINILEVVHAGAAHYDLFMGRFGHEASDQYFGQQTDQAGPDCMLSEERPKPSLKAETQSVAFSGTAAGSVAYPWLPRRNNMALEVQENRPFLFPASDTQNVSLPLRVDGLVKRFGRVTAVDGITLELRSGECLGLLGPNGAGKPTLIRSIVGRVIPDAGTISVFGAPANSKAARQVLGWIPQELALYPRLTCRENLEAFGRYHGGSGAA